MNNLLSNEKVPDFLCLNENDKDKIETNEKINLLELQTKTEIKPPTSQELLEKLVGFTPNESSEQYLNFNLGTISIKNHKSIYEELKNNYDVGTGLLVLKNLKNNNLTIDSCPKEFNFPIGHPRDRIVYMKHPLSNRVESKKMNFIPFDECDQILQDEKKAELLAILGDLGASFISIVEVDERSSNQQLNIEAEILQRGANLDARTKQALGIENIIINQLEGTWQPNKELDLSQYVWIEENPLWKTMIRNRTENKLFKWSYTFQKNESTERGIRTTFTWLDESLTKIGLTGSKNKKKSLTSIVIVEFPNCPQN